LIRRPNASVEGSPTMFQPIYGETRFGGAG
jgi:hypothetical protein